MKTRLLLVVHCLELLALAAWVGGLVTIIGAVVPAVFNTVSVEAGGRMLTRTFQGYDWIVLISAAVLILGLLIRTRLQTDGGPEIATVEPLLLATMVSIAVLLVFYLNPAIVKLQEAAFASKDELAKRSAYVAFFRYHWTARGLYVANLLLGVVAICLKARRGVR
ncbi:MAG TPA: DUF4149 domain-containing protein [Nitrospirales bacterium]